MRIFIVIHLPTEGPFICKYKAVTACKFNYLAVIIIGLVITASSLHFFGQTYFSLNVFMISLCFAVLSIILIVSQCLLQPNHHPMPYLSFHLL